jgi:hypothetical protein
MENEPKPLNGGVFVGARPPIWDLEHEQPWHRTAAYFFAMGDTSKNVALKLGKSQPAVQNLLRQPWFQKLVTQLMAENGNRDISKLFQAEQLNNYCTLVEIRDSPDTSAAIKLKCAEVMLDRSMGKATQRVELSHETASEDPVAEFERLEAENKRLREELDRK